MQSVWSNTIEKKKPRPTLTGEVDTDVLVVGGGMAGVLTAYRLKIAGLRCVIAEAKTVGSGVTKNTTAKITAQHGLIYADIIRNSGLEKAKGYLDVNTQAIEEFRALASMHPCDFEEKTAYVYSVDRRDKLEREANAYQKLGLCSDIVETASLPFKTAGALGMVRQAQFNPLKLLTALSDDLDIYENTLILDIDGNIAQTADGKIRAKYIILTTHFPMINIPGLYFMKLYQHRSYVIALRGAPMLEGMFVDEREDGHSFRTYQDLLLVGGGDHKTGKTGGGFEELRSLSKKAWPLADEGFCWATQDCMSLDCIPYIGRHHSGDESLYVATGFNKWGMTGSMVAARLLCDLLVHGKSEMEALYSPRRSMITPQLAVNLGSAAAGIFSIGGPRCTHMGCKLHKNNTEGTWDCPCHGSRFDQAGKIIDNPAKRGAKL